jgi:YegS/Rv2252/BmrU family lipid kinase
MENNTTQQKFQHIYVILNPIAGHSEVEDLRPAMKKCFEGADITYEIYETTGEENIAEITRKACAHGADLVIAAGGDGTVAGVVDGLVKEDIPLGIVPVGTGNGLARALGIPLDPQAALELILGEHRTLTLDTLQVGDRYFTLNVSAGISSRAMRETPPEKKRRFGVLAYVQTIVKDALQGKTSVFNLIVDGRRWRVRGAEVLVSNGLLLQEPPLLYGPRETYQDGKLELNILTAEKATDYVRLAKDLLLDPQDSKTDLQDMSVHQSLVLDVAGRSLPVQADGELIGHTPVEVRLAPKALKVIIPGEEIK